MERFTLQASRRTVTGKKVGQLRAAGKTPAILYGKTLDKPIPVTIDHGELAKLLRKASYSSLITVNVEGEEHSTLVRDFQMDFIKGTLKHVDFLVVSLTETVSTEVRIIIEGKAPVVVDQGGLLVPGLESVEVESLPQDLPENFVVDVSGFTEFGDAIFVRDLVVPENVSILTDPDELLVVATAPAAEEAEVAVEGAEGAEAAAGEEGAAGEEAAGEDAGESGEAE